MIRSLRTGVTGLKSHQSRMDVVGNNIANVNTLAYKRSRAVFNEVLGQQLLGLSRTGGASGVSTGIVGYGVAIGAVSQNWSQGSLEFTNVTTDVALNGDGFFIVRNGDRNLMTRAGNFVFDQDGTLVTYDGLSVQGYAMDQDGTTDTSRLSDIVLDYAVQAEPMFTENIVTSNNLSADLAIGESIDLQTGVFDEQGEIHSVNVRFTKVAENQWSYDVLYTGEVAPPPFNEVSGVLNFGVDGKLIDDAPISVAWDGSAVTGGGTFMVDVAGLTQFSRLTTATVLDRDGYKAGQLDDFSIDAEGVLWLNFSNGERQAAYQFVIGNVNNPNALENRGENFFSLTPGSGDLILGRPGREVSTAMVSGALELSNTDLATEFTDMIIAQRGYQASARVITTSDELLQEVVQLKR